MFEKNEFLKNIWFSAIKYKPWLKFQETLITLGDDMALCKCMLSLACQIPIIVTAHATWGLDIWAPPVNEKKPTWTILCNH